MIFRHYWDWAGSNIGAMPAEALITAVCTVVFTLVFRRPLARLADRGKAWLHRENQASLRLARDDAAKARAIAADLYRHVTGEEHPHAPAE